MNTIKKTFRLPNWSDVYIILVTMAIVMTIIIPFILIGNIPIAYATGWIFSVIGGTWCTCNGIKPTDGNKELAIVISYSLAFAGIGVAFGHMIGALI